MASSIEHQKRTTKENIWLEDSTIDGTKLCTEQFNDGTNYEQMTRPALMLTFKIVQTSYNILTLFSFCNEIKEN